MTILSSSMVEIMLLHSWPKYDAARNGVQTFDGSWVTQERLIEQGVEPSFAEDLFSLFYSISRCKLSAESIGLLCCLVLFSPDRNYSKELDSGIHMFV